MLLQTNLPASLDNSTKSFTLLTSTNVLINSISLSIIFSLLLTIPRLSGKLQELMFLAVVSRVKVFLILASPNDIIKS